MGQTKRTLRTGIFLVACASTFATSAFRANAAPGNGNQAVGGVFTMTNAFDPAGGNEVVMYARGADGTLDLVGAFPTGGQGTGAAPAPLDFLAADPLGSQNSLVLTEGHKFLLGVNGGSDNITVFRVNKNELLATDLEPSGGHYPVGLATQGNLVYSLNAGGEGSISGYRLNKGTGDLTAIPGSERSLGQGLSNPPFVPAGPGMIGFSPNGGQLIVTVKEAPAGPGRILVYSLDNNDLPAASPVVLEGQAEAPFGFDFDRQGHLLVAEPLGNGTLATVESASSVSSYELSPDGSLQSISSSVPNQLGGACWLLVIGDFAYVTNTATHNISVYQIATDGTLALAPVGAFDTGDPAVPSFNLDIARTQNGQFLYVLEPGSGGVSAWGVNGQTGALTLLDETGGLEAFVPDPLPTEPFSDLTGSPAGLAAY